MKRFFLLLTLLSVLFFLFSCDAETTDAPETGAVFGAEDVETTEPLDHRYTLHPLTASASDTHRNILPYSSVLVRENEIRCLTYRNILETDDTSYTLTENLLFSVYDRTGAFLREEEIPVTNETVRIADVWSVYPISDGYVYLAVQIFEDNQPVIGIADKNGVQVLEIVPALDGAPTAFAANDSYICCADTKACHIYSPELEELFVTECAFPMQVLCFDGDTVIVGDGCREYVRIDPAEKTAHPLELSLPDGIYGSFISETCVYTASADGVFAGEELLLDWENSSIRGDRVQLLSVPDNDTMVVLFDDPFSGGKTYAVLDRSPEQNAVILTATLVGEYDGQNLREAIDAYNRQSERYHVTVRSYDAEYIARTGNIMVDYTAFTDEITKGKRTDFYLIGLAGFLVTDLADKNVFLDLSPLLPEPVFPFTKEMYRTNDLLYGAVLGVNSLEVLAQEPGKAGDSMNVNTLLDRIDALGENELLFSGYIGNALWNISMRDFYDKENGICRFDSPEFLRFLPLLGDQSRFSGTRFGGLETSSSMFQRYEMSNGVNPAEALENGSLSYLHLRLDADDGGMAAFAYTKFCFGNRPFSLCGFPSEKVNCITADSSCTLMADADTRHQKGIADVIAYLLSDAVQTSPGWTKRAMPITESAFRSQFYEYNYIGVSPCSDSENSCFSRMEGEYGSGHKQQSAFVRDSLLYDHTEVIFSEQEVDELIRFLSSASTVSLLDHTVEDIVTEELSYVRDSVRTYEEAAALIQNRVRLYINE